MMRIRQEDHVGEPKRRLYRSTQDRMIGGVCGGLGDYFNIDATLVRLAFVIVTLLGGAGVLAYIIMWIVMPLPTGNADLASGLSESAQQVIDDARTWAETHRPGAATTAAPDQPAGPPPDQTT
jgi:phage shock protein C